MQVARACRSTLHETHPSYNRQLFAYPTPELVRGASAFHRENALVEPDLYPTWDWNVDEALWQCNKRDPFATFMRQDMQTYSKFAIIVEAFHIHFCLREFSFKIIDEFLWMWGGRRIATQRTAR